MIVHPKRIPMKLNLIIRRIIAAVSCLILFSQSVWAQPANDNCTSPTNLTPGTSCTVTAGTLNNATMSTGVPAACATGNLFDVWYTFTATGTNHTITISGYGTSFTRRQMILYAGACGALFPVSGMCTAVQTSGTSLVLTSTDLTPGTVYFIRVIFANTTGISTNGGFNICVTGTAPGANNPTVQVGKSYTNLSKPNGGVIENGNTLEFRSVIAVSGGSAYNTVYSDTIPSGLAYVPNSIKFSTNEGMKYQSGITGLINLTDASGDDEAVFSGNVMRVNVPSLTRNLAQTVFQAYAATTPITTASYGGGKIRSNGRPSFYGGTCIVMVTYQVTVTAATGTIFTTANGAFRYKTATGNTNDGTFPQIVAPLPRFSVFVSPNVALCPSTVGLNNYSGGDFGQGTTRHDSTQLTIAPGYTWNPFTSGQPNDGRFNVANNTSVNLSTNKYQAYNNNAIRVFGWWDIIGDHTNAANQDSGNFAVPYGTLGGYMAVVNANYAINNAVQRTITGLCTDTYYEFTSWFKNICPGCSCDTSGNGATSTSFKSYIPTALKNRNDSAGVQPDLTFQVDGVDYYLTGSIPYNRMWMQKGFLFRTGSSQTSATLTIRNNAPGGGGNDWVMDDIVLGTCLPTLQLRPGPNPSYCLNSQIDLSVVVTSYYNNYTYYEWERSTDGGATWITAPEMPGVRTYTYTAGSGVFRDTVAIPSFLSESTKNGWRYRVKTATSVANLNNNGCSVYNNAQIFTLNIRSDCDVLPVNLLQFNAVIEQEKGVLHWLAKNEDNLKHYEIERSVNGTDFKKIGTVSAVNAAVSETSYSFTDADAINGKFYYRLKMVAAGNETYKYSNVLVLSLLNSRKFELTNVVNPFESSVRFTVQAPYNELAEAQLLDASGRYIQQIKVQLRKGVNVLEIAGGNGLGRGTYFLRIKTTTGWLNKMIQHQ